MEAQDAAGFDDIDVDERLGEASSSEDEADSEELKETPAEKRMRLARQYLQTLEEQASADADATDAAQLDREIIASRLRQEALSISGKAFSRIAETVGQHLNPSPAFSFRGHRLAVTSVAITDDERLVFSASKDGTILQWTLATGAKSVVATSVRRKPLPLVSSKTDAGPKSGHAGAVLCLAVSGDGALLASGGQDGLLALWNVVEGRQRAAFRQHRGPVTGVCFRRGAHQVYSCSADRTVKVWDGDESAYVETLFGHQDVCASIDALSRERCLTAGGRDRTVRLWTILEESHLVFRGGLGALEVARFVNEDHFVTGADDGSVALWQTSKKKALCTIAAAHAKWVTSVATCPYTDLVATGSWDGSVRLWRITDGFKGLEPVGSLPVVGFVNALAFSPSGRRLVVGVGQEHRLGRWDRVPEARNGVLVFDLRPSTTK